MAHDAFISHSSKDKIIADAVCGTLEGKNIRCWIAPRDVPPGTHYGAALDKAIENSKIFILLISKGSNNSDQVIRELEIAADNGIPIIPIRIEDIEPTDAMRYYVKSLHWLDAMTPPLERHLEKITASVKALLSIEADETTSPVGETITETLPKKRLALPLWASILIGLTALLIFAGWYGLTRLNKTGAETRELNLSLTEQVVSTLDKNAEIQNTSSPPSEDHPFVPPTSTSIATPMPTYSQQEGSGDSGNVPCSELMPDLDMQMHLEICDTFDTNVNEWQVDEYTSSDLNMDFKMSNGAYVWYIECKNNNYGCATATLPNRTSRTSDFYLVVDIGRIEGPINMQYGIRFRDDGQNYYEFLVSDNQKYSVSSWADGKFEFLIFEQTAAMLKPNEVNRLALQAIGTRFVFYINNDMVGELDNDNLPEGVSGVGANLYNSGKGTLQIDNFGLYVP